MRKIDVILAALIGFLNGIFFFSILKETEIKIPYSWTLPVIFPIFSTLGLFIASHIGKKILIIFQAAKFFLVGTLNTFVDLGVLNLLMWTFKIYRGAFYSVFAAISFLAATTNSYFWNKFWTFEKRKESLKTKEFLKFLVITTIGLGINVGVASFIVNVIGPKFGLTEKIWANVGKIIAAFFAFIWNFLGSKFIVFQK